MSDDKQRLRDEIRDARRGLKPTIVKQQSAAIHQQLLTLPALNKAKQIGAYFAFQNEVSLSALIEYALTSQKQIYLPVIAPAVDKRMSFYHYEKDTKLTPNIFNILEPDTDKAAIKPEQLDVLLVPLVAFDKRCNRIGQGSGYYDRYLEHYRHKTQKPTLIGVAFEMQKVEKVPHKPWDYPLDMVVTEEKIYHFTR